jgi:acyl-[acyl-carrier-protein]-phospholipid O-acyltransferase/long-chain-fatty-acid--[acyl-carrier-protein] ligase
MAVATPTFLMHYIRKIEPERLGSLQVVLTGAEKLREAVATAFERKFGLRPLEGYGCTECSPVVCVNTPDFRAPGLFQVGIKPGTIGHPLPGVSIRIVDPASGEELEDGREGLMLVSGPNVMKGYLGQPDLTAKVLRDGWYETGDIAKIDEDGFVEITDRLARFSKIGGEMVPHLRVEDALQKAVGATFQAFVVAGIPDGRKGEKLVVLYTVAPEEAKKASEAINAMDLPKLWLPKWADYHQVTEIPILGTGKMDLRQIKAIALEKNGPVEE